MEGVEIPGFSRYAVTDDGAVYGPTGRRLKPFRVKGTMIVSLRNDDGVKTTMSIHRLVCLAYHGAPKDGQIALHATLDLDDNRKESVRWGSPEERSNLRTLRKKTR